jgi:hypothetical protein
MRWGAGLFILQLVAARVYTGDFTDPPPASAPGLSFIGSFAFSTDVAATGPTVGTVVVEYTTALQNLYLVGYVDTAWGPIFNSDDDCDTVLKSATIIEPLVEGGKQLHFTIPSNVIDRPAFWYFAMVNLPTCGNIRNAPYTIILTQADGDQLSYDEYGMPTFYIAMTVVFGLLLGIQVSVHYISHKGFSAAENLFLCLSLITFTVSCGCGAAYWATIESTGVGDDTTALCMYAFRFLSGMLIFVLTYLIANGYGILSYSLQTFRNVAGVFILLLMLIGYVAALLFRMLDYDPADPNLDILQWPLLLLMAITLGFAIWFGTQLYVTLKQQMSGHKRKALLRIAACVSLHFLVLPLTEGAAALTPEYLRFRVRSMWRFA